MNSQSRLLLVKVQKQKLETTDESLIETYKQLDDVSEALSQAASTPEKQVPPRRKRMKGSPVKPSSGVAELKSMKENLMVQAAKLQDRSSGRIMPPQFSAAAAFHIPNHPQI